MKIILYDKKTVHKNIICIAGSIISLCLVDKYVVAGVGLYLLVIAFDFFYTIKQLKKK